MNNSCVRVPLRECVGPRTHTHRVCIYPFVSCCFLYFIYLFIYSFYKEGYKHGILQTIKRMFTLMDAM